MRRVPLLTLVLAAAALGPAAGAALGAAPLVYTGADAANAIHDGSDAVPGVTDALRQSPIYEDRRWPLDRRVGKVTGRQLAPLGATGIADALRRAWSEHDAGGRVAIDEFVPGQWTDAGAAELAEAIRQLGPDAERVFVYASPALVAQVGRVDPRKPLAGRNASLFAATAGSGRAYLELYLGSLEPLPARDMAVVLIRWSGRWPAERTDRLHALIGPAARPGRPRSGAGCAPARPAGRSWRTGPAPTG